MEQTNNNFFIPPAEPSNFLTTHSFTPRSPHHQFIPALVKLASLREQQRDSLTNFHIRLAENHLTGKQKKVKVRENMLESLSVLQQLNLESLNQLKISNGKFIDKIKLYQPESTTHKKNYNSYLQKCRLATESYDQLRKQVINKNKHPKSLHKCSKSKNDQNYYKINISGITNKYCDKFLIEKDNNIELLTNGSRRMKHTRYKSYSESSKKSQRYIEISVAQFMQEQQHKISSSISKKFQQYQKQNEKHNKSLQQNYEQLQPGQSTVYGKMKNKKIHLATNQRLVYPIITHAF